LLPPEELSTAKLAGPQRCDAEHHPYAVVPNDCKLIPIPEVPRDRPRRTVRRIGPERLRELADG
jgi:hypothetical protein